METIKNNINKSVKLSVKDQANNIKNIAQIGSHNWLINGRIIRSK